MGPSDDACLYRSPRPGSGYADSPHYPSPTFPPCFATGRRGPSGLGPSGRGPSGRGPSGLGPSGRRRIVEMHVEETEAMHEDEEGEGQGDDAGMLMAIQSLSMLRHADVADTALPHADTYTDGYTRNGYTNGYTSNGYSNGEGSGYGNGYSSASSSAAASPHLAYGSSYGPSHGSSYSSSYGPSHGSSYGSSHGSSYGSPYRSTYSSAYPVGPLPSSTHYTPSYSTPSNGAYFNKKVRL